MRISRKRPCAALALALAFTAMLAVPAVSLAAQPTVDLGKTSSFAVLAGTTITNTGATTVGGSAGGDLGLYPGTDFPGLAQVTRSGSVHLADNVARDAKDDLVAAYNDAAGRTPVTIIPTELGGTTLKPGVYASTSGTFHITGTLSLDASGDPDAVFIFKTNSTLITASNSTVSLLNSARYCRVFWKVGSSATLGTNSNFAGHIFALTSIAAQTGATVQGQLLARNGAVTLDHNTIMNGICVVGPAINVSKRASRQSLTGPGWVTFTYLLSNTGTVPLSNVGVTDDRISSVKYVSGDLNTDHLLQPNEIWVYTARAYLDTTTSNTATAEGSSAAGLPVSDTATTRVVVSAGGGGEVTATASGEELPKTATPWYNLLLAGILLTFAGALGWWRANRKISA